MLRPRLRSAVALALLAAPAGALAPQKPDLAELYPATLEAEAGSGPYTWKCTAEDVWELRSFQLEVARLLKVKLGPSLAILGHHDRNVMWALVVPERTAKLSSEVRGDGEEIAHVWMRFHPARLGELFPVRTVTGPGDGGMRVFGEWVARHKLPGPWAEDGRPLLPERSQLFLDVETTEGKRRPFLIDLDRESIEYESGLQADMLPALQPIERRDASEALEKVVELMELGHASGPHAVELDWKAESRDLSRRAARLATTLDEIGRAHV